MREPKYQSRTDRVTNMLQHLSQRRTKAPSGLAQAVLICLIKKVDLEHYDYCNNADKKETGSTFHQSVLLSIAVIVTECDLPHRCPHR